MHANNQMRFAMAIHMLQKSNPATRHGLESKRGATRRHLRRAEQRTEPQATTDSQPA